MKKSLSVALALLCLLCFQVTSFSGEISEEDKAALLQAISLKGYSDAVVQFNLRISIPEMAGHESAELWGTLIKHACDKETGEEIPLPTILVDTCYRREAMAMVPLTLFPRGYNILTVDVRGSGSASGIWSSLDFEEHLDVAYVIDEWIPKHAWSDGKVGMIGPSYMAILQMMAAGNIDVDENGEPVHLKALFPYVPMSDTYKDIVFQGGNLDLSFIPIWLFGTDFMALLPSTLLFGGENAGLDGSWEDEDYNMLKEARDNWLDTFRSIKYNVSWFADLNNMVDGDFFDEKSSMIYWPEKSAATIDFLNRVDFLSEDNVIPSKLPVFMTAGWFDIFTRGSLNHYQYGLKNHSVEDKAMIVGPWYHLDGSFGLGVDGLMPTTNAIPGRWFDWKIKGIEDPFMVEFPVTLYVMGANKWRAEKSWPLPETRTEKSTLYLSKRKAVYNWRDWFSLHNLKNNYRLVEEMDADDFKRDDPVLEHKPAVLHGLVSRSSSRWLIGVPSLLHQVTRFLFGVNMDHTSPNEDERLDEVGCLTFTTPALTEDVEITGPLTLTFWAKTEFGDPVEDTLFYRFFETFFKATGNTLDEDVNTIKNMIEEDDVQWVVEVNDVYPLGRARNVTSGWLRASHRPYDNDDEFDVDDDYTPFDPFYDKADRNPKMIKEGSLYKYVVEIWPTCNVFRKGHKIRVSLSGSDFPHLMPIMVPSENTIVIDEDHQAKLDFTTANSEDEGDTWMWIEEDGLFDELTNYMIHHNN